MDSQGVVENPGNSFPGNAEYIRVVNGNDNVINLPPEVLGFVHQGQLVKIRDPGEVSKNLEWTGINADHAILNYTINLRNHYDK